MRATPLSAALAARQRFLSLCGALSGHTAIMRRKFTLFQRAECFRQIGGALPKCDFGTHDLIIKKVNGARVRVNTLSTAIACVRGCVPCSEQEPPARSEPSALRHTAYFIGHFKINSETSRMWFLRLSPRCSAEAYLGRFAPYLLRDCLRFATPAVSSAPRMMW